MQTMFRCVGTFFALLVILGTFSAVCLTLSTQRSLICNAVSFGANVTCRRICAIYAMLFTQITYLCRLMKFVWLLTFFTKKIICIALLTITIITCFAITRPLKTMSNFTLLTMIRVLFAFSTVLTTWFAFSSISYTDKSHLFSISL